MINNEIDPNLQARLDELKSVAPRDPVATMHGRAKFLDQALKIEEAVSAGGFLRHIGWISMKKEKLAMNILITLILTAGVLFGGGATVNAAQDDLPGQPLYAVKTASEDVSLQFQNNPEEKVTRLMELAQIRIQEMAALTEAGQTPPDQVRLRLEQHIQQALQTCIDMDDATLDQTLLRLRDQLREQDRDLEQLQIHASQEAQPLLERTRSTLHLRLQLVNDGLLDHEMFRNTVRNGFRNGQEQEQTPPAPNGHQNGEQIGQPTSAPGGPNTEPSGPNTESGGPKIDPSGPNADATPGPNQDNGSGTGPASGTGTSSGNGSGMNGSGGNGTGGNGTGGNSPGGSKP